MLILQVATALLAVMAIVHFAITVVLSVLVIWVRCYCKNRDGCVVSSKDLSPEPNTAGEGELRVVVVVLITTGGSSLQLAHMHLVAPHSLTFSSFCSLPPQLVVYCITCRSMH